MGDLFLRVYDELVMFNISDLVDMWDDDVNHRSAVVRDQALATGDVPDPVDSEPSSLLVTLLGLHQALMYADPDRDVPDKRGLAPCAAWYQLRHRLNSDPADGLLMYTRAIAGRPDPSLDPDDHTDLVPGLLRMTAHQVEEVDLRFVSALLDLRSPAPPAGIDDEFVGTAPLRVAQLPFVTRDDVRWRIVKGRKKNRSAYEVVPVTANLVPRVAQAVRALDGIPENTTPHVVLLPEASLDDVVLAAWIDALAHPRRGRRGTAWILVGTGPVTHIGGPSGNGRRRPNRAVVLNSTGQIVFTQDKRAGFSLDERQLKRYRLTKTLGKTGPLTEHIRKGSKITVMDASAGRFAIAICEDHGRIVRNSGYYRSSGVTHLLVPVIAPAMWDGGWQAVGGSVLATDAGSCVAVSNGIAVDQQNRDKDGKETGIPAATLCVVRAPHSGPVIAHGVVEQQMVGLDPPLRPPAEDAVTVRTTIL